MNIIIDLIIAAIIAFNVILGWKQGFVKTALKSLVLVVALIAAFSFVNPVRNYVLETENGKNWQDKIHSSVITVLAIVDYVVPMYFTKVTGGSRYAERGAMAGLIIGIFLTPVGMILGSFLGAFISELYWGKKGAMDALKAAGGSFLGFITGTGLKTIVACLILWKIFVFAF